MPSNVMHVRGNKKNDDKAIIEAYQKYLERILKDKKITEEDKNKWLMKALGTGSSQSNENRCLTFDGPDSSHNFFEELANEGVCFVAFCVDKNGTLTGEYKFSNGDGTMSAGKMSAETASALSKQLATINQNPEMLKQVTAALKAKDESKLKTVLEQLNNNTQTMRTAVQQAKIAPEDEGKEEGESLNP